MQNPLHITHIITGLDIGGAEMMLYKLLLALDPAEFSSQVISLRCAGPMAQRIRSLGVPVKSLGISAGMPHLSQIQYLVRLLREQQPDVVQTWMYHADLLGGLAARFAGRPPVVWNIRNSTLDPETSKRTTRWTVQACAQFSQRWPAQIVSCSSFARDLHVGLGYDAAKMTVIPNGFELSLFQPDANARQAVRAELNLSPGTLLIGAVGRFDPQKDYHNLISAAGWLHAARPDVHFLLCGKCLTEENEKLMGWIYARGLQKCFHLLGRRDDVPRLMNSFDLLTTSSAYGEAFPLVVGEAMACEVPCVVTDLGDSAFLVGDTGKVVPPREPAALAAAWNALLSLPAEKRAALGAAARQRIETHFSLSNVAGQYAALYRELGRRSFR